MILFDQGDVAKDTEIRYQGGIQGNQAKSVSFLGREIDKFPIQQFFTTV
jgi:hypothetical protein